jgi:hypothetical protein
VQVTDVRSRVLIRAIGLLSIVLVRSLDAKAEPVHSHSLTPNLKLSLRADEPIGLRLALYDLKHPRSDEKPLTVCFDRCELRTPPGRYLLRISGPPGADVHASRGYVDLREDSVVLVDPPSSTARYAGLGLGVLGPVLILGGLFVAVNSTDLTGQHDQPYYTLGLVGFAGGVIATPVGWVMFGANGRPSIEVYPSRGTP